MSPADPNALPARRPATLTAAEVEALGIDRSEGGFQGLTLTGPDGKFYSFSLRPLLPDDELGASRLSRPRRSARRRS